MIFLLTLTLVLLGLLAWLSIAMRTANRKALRAETRYREFICDLTVARTKVRF